MSSDEKANVSRRRLSIMRRLEFCCYAGALVLLGTWLLWTRSYGRIPEPILPPAGEVIPQSAPFTFAIMGDNRGHMGTVTDILHRAQADQARVILHVGDLAETCSEREYDWLLETIHKAKLSVPFCAVPGNHDLASKTAPPDERCRFYERAFGQRCYWFALGDALFVALDNSTGVFSADDLRWLDDTLGRLRGQFPLCFVVMHEPIRDPRPGNAHSMGKEGGDALAAMFKKYHVSAMFTGHIHAFLEGNVEGVPVYITGGAGATLYEPERVHHYALCHVNADGSFSVEKKAVPNHGGEYVERLFRLGYSPDVGLGVAVALLFTGLLLRKRSQARG